jgi:hypothetical protein
MFGDYAQTHVFFPQQGFDVGGDAVVGVYGVYIFGPYQTNHALVVKFFRFGKDDDLPGLFGQIRYRLAPQVIPSGKSEIGGKAIGPYKKLVREKYLAAGAGKGADRYLGFTLIAAPQQYDLAKETVPDMVGDKSRIGYYRYILSDSSQLLRQKRAAGSRFDHHRFAVFHQFSRGLGDPLFRFIVIGHPFSHIVRLIDTRVTVFTPDQTLFFKVIQVFPYRNLRNIKHVRQNGYFKPLAPGKSLKNSGMPIGHFFLLFKWLMAGSATLAWGIFCIPILIRYNFY